MPRVSVVAKNYAKALFVASRKNNALESVTSELEIFKQNFSTSFAHELKNPVIAKNDLVRIIEEVTKKFSLGRITSSFFASIVRNRRLNLFPEIYEEFMRLIKAYQKVLEVEVIYATKPVASQVENIRKRVKELVEKKYPGKIVAIREIIKEKILGGLQIRIGSEVIDASLKAKIVSIGKECLKVIN